jgi:hypothetical protein
MKAPRIVKRHEKHPYAVIIDPNAGEIIYQEQGHPDVVVAKFTNLNRAMEMARKYYNTVENSFKFLNYATNK